MRGRAYTRSQRERVINKRLKLLQKTNSSLVDNIVLGRMSKMHPLDCGNPKCQLCHYSKVHKLKTLKDITDENNIREQIENQYEKE